jgi:transketolase
VWIEAGATVGWRALSRPGDDVIGVDQFGASAPGAEVYARLGFTATRVVEAANAVVHEAGGIRRA